MTRDDIRKLLGGYATGTLTPGEQQALIAAALEDQELFDALAKEQALRDLLRDPSARAHLLASLDERPGRWWALLLRPAAVGAMAAVCLAAVVGYGVWHARQARRPVLVAANHEMKVAPFEAAPPASTEAGKATAERDAGRLRRLPAATPAPAEVLSAPAAAAPGGGVDADSQANKDVVDGLKAARPPQPVSPQVQKLDAAPSTAMFGKGGMGGMGLGGMAPAPPPAAAPKPAALEEANAAGSAGGTSHQAVARRSGFAPLPQTVAVESATSLGQQAQVRQTGQRGFGQAAPAQAEQSKTQSGPAAQSQEVTPEAPQLEALSADRQQISQLPANAPLGAPRKRDLAAQATVTAGVKWTTLRRGPRGRLSPVAPEEIRAGDAIVVRLEPYADGTLSVGETLAGSPAPRVLMAGTPVKRAQPVDTPAITLNRPGARELLLRFTPQSGAAAPAQTVVLRFR